MASADSLARLGLFVAEHFLDREECASLRGEMEKAPAEEAGVYRERDTVNAATRRTAYAQVSAETASRIAGKLDRLLPILQDHFGVRLQGHQPPHFLVYQTGDFFKAHTDVVPENAPDYIQARRISIVIFVNDEADEPTPDSYTGGRLTFYGLAGDGPFQNLGLPLNGREGLLVAFPADVLHAVTPVTHGKRFTIVTWCC
jgi:SM-20-related protein